jgi:hypothetical protein
MPLPRKMSNSTLLVPKRFQATALQRPTQSLPAWRQRQPKRHDWSCVRMTWWIREDRCHSPRSVPVDSNWRKKNAAPIVRMGVCIMARRVVSLILAGCLLGVLSGTARAEAPPYLLLRTPSAPLPHQPTYARYPGDGYGVSTHSYAYGWFGAAPRKHWTRHFGYYRSYTQWSGK